MEMDTSSSAGVPDVNSVSMLWPSKALQYNNTYLVAYRGLVNTDGIDIVPSTAFLVCMLVYCLFICILIFNISQISNVHFFFTVYFPN